ncbi:hypothetical protein BEN30_17345 [Magnetovibrio blakemorei]|uniref:Histidine kinase/HSP90-like ATPase domain-containing protein n=2 Tax=Magnetovibrio blakemorei TaxID=28181 RepID=A0A1E5Q2V8_9PROT|nr:hypothetical protein BEN30_17345 [Magnetovibrio blakemorei]
MEGEKHKTDLKVCIVKVKEEYHVDQARREAMEMAVKIGFDKSASHAIGTSVTELATNLVFYAVNGGTIFIRSVAKENRVGIEVVSEDFGPGIEDVKAAMQDGYSTGGGLGGGLPGINRLMDEFEIVSNMGMGTKIITRKWKK